MSAREELKELARGFRWGRRPLVPASAEPYAEPREEPMFPTDWARSKAGVAARRFILNVGIHTLASAELSLRAYGEDRLEDVPGPVIFFSNHSSHLDFGLVAHALGANGRDLVVLAVGNGYLQALSGAARVETSEAQLESAQTLFNKATDQQNAGLSPAIDSLRTSSSVCTSSTGMSGSSACTASIMARDSAAGSPVVRSITRPPSPLGICASGMKA